MKKYCICNDCGIRLFIRGIEGIKILNSLIGDILTETETISILNTINYFDKIKEKLIEAEDKKTYLIGR